MPDAIPVDQLLGIANNQLTASLEQNNEYGIVLALRSLAASTLFLALVADMPREY